MWQGTLVCILRSKDMLRDNKYVILSTSGMEAHFSGENLKYILSTYPDCLSNAILNYGSIEVTQGELSSYLCDEVDYSRCFGVSDILNGYTYNAALPVVTCRIEDIDGRLLGYRVALYLDGAMIVRCHNPQALFNLVNNHDFANAYVKDGELHISGALTATLRESPQGIIMGVDIRDERGNIEYKTKLLEACYYKGSRRQVGRADAWLKKSNNTLKGPAAEPEKEPSQGPEKLDLNKLIDDIEKVERWAEEESEESFILRL